MPDECLTGLLRFPPMPRPLKVSLLFFFFVLCVAAVLLTRQMQLRAPAPAPHELFSVVEKQLADFRASDYPNAYLNAASGVQQKFTMPQFEAMIRREYPQMTNARRIEFGFVEVKGSTAVVQVFFLGESGIPSSFLYSLIAEGKAWKISGVQQVRSAPSARQFSGTHA